MNKPKILQLLSLDVYNSPYFGYKDAIHEIETFLSFASTHLHILHLYGEAGIGKTALIRNTQHRHKEDQKIIIINVCNLFGYKVDEIEELLQELRDNCDSGIVVFDEVETLSNFKNEFAEVINEFIRNWKSKIILITQGQDGVDWLGVQVTKSICLRKPNLQEIEQIMSHLLSSNQSISHIDLPKITSVLEGRTPSEIQVFVREASMSKLRQYVDDNPGCLNNNSVVDSKFLEIKTEDLLKAASILK